MNIIYEYSTNLAKCAVFQSWSRKIWTERNLKVKSPGTNLHQPTMPASCSSASLVVVRDHIGFDHRPHLQVGVFHLGRFERMVLRKRRVVFKGSVKKERLTWRGSSWNWLVFVFGPTNLVGSLVQWPQKQIYFFSSTYLQVELYLGDLSHHFS